jgi:hypothetical protein
MRTKFILSILALVLVAVVILGSAGYIYAHPNAYPKEEPREKFFNRNDNARSR